MTGEQEALADGLRGRTVTIQQDTETLSGQTLSGVFTRARRTDLANVRAAIDRGDFADARWLRCENQLAMINAEPEASRAAMRSFIVSSSGLFDMGELMVQVRPPNSETH